MPKARERVCNSTSQRCPLIVKLLSVSMYEYTKTFEDPWKLKGFTTVGGGPQQTTAAPTTMTGSRSGNKVDNWKELVAQGLNASSPFLTDRTRVESFVDADATLVAHPTAYPNDTYAHVFRGQPRGYRPFEHLSVNVAEADSVALSKLYRKLKAETTQFSGASFAAEALDVVRQFGRPLQSLMAVHDRWRKRAYSAETAAYLKHVRYEPVAWGKLMADLWVEYSFGLAPIMSDTEELAEALARFNHDDAAHKLRAKRQSRSLVSESQVNQELSDGYVGNTYFRTRETEVLTTEGRVQYIVGLQGDIRAAFGSAERLRQLCGFNHADWVPALWEAVPWSWLVDYFLNIQQILEAAVTPTDRVSWICKTVSRQTTCARSYPLTVQTGGSWSAKDIAIKTAPSVTMVRTTVQRSIPLSLGVPPLYFKTPFGSWKKMANLAAVFLYPGRNDSKLLKLGNNGLG